MVNNRPIHIDENTRHTINQEENQDNEQEQQNEDQNDTIYQQNDEDQSSNIEAWGNSTQAEVDEHTLRVYFQNVNGIKVEQEMTRWHLAMEEMNDRKV